MRILTALPVALVLSALVVVSCSTKSPGDGKEGRATSPTSTTNRPCDQTQIQDVPTLNSAEYGEFLAMRKEGPVIPGIFQSAVPQGLAYYADQHLLIISCYMTDGSTSSIAIVSMEDGTLQRVLRIEEPDGTAHTGHVGGLAISRTHLWVASGHGVFYVGLDALENSETLLRMSGFYQTAAKGSFSTFSNGTLWVGEFTSRNGNYPTERSHSYTTPSGELYHGWMAGFSLDPDTDLIKSGALHDGIFYPDMIISIPHEVQGATITEKQIVLSQSYGRKNNSRIAIYRNPLGGEAAANQDPGSGSTIPLWVLDRTGLVGTVTAPPMTEGIAVYDKRIAVLFESGSDKYRSTARNPTDRIQILDVGW